MINKIDVTKSLPQEEWAAFFDQFSEYNTGRFISIEITDAELRDEELIQNDSLMAVIYDRPDKRHGLVIEIGKDIVNYAHMIDSPTEISTGENLYGEIIAIHIADAVGTKTLVKLEAS